MNAENQLLPDEKKEPGLSEKEKKMIIKIPAIPVGIAA